MRLTKAERETLYYLHVFWRRAGHAPTQRELAELLGWKSRGQLLRCIASLKSHDLVHTIPGRNRTLTPGPKPRTERRR